MLQLITKNKFLLVIEIFLIKNYRYRATLHSWIFTYASLKAIYEFTLIQFKSIFETSYLRYAYTKSAYVKQILKNRFF